MQRFDVANVTRWFDNIQHDRRFQPFLTLLPPLVPIRVNAAALLLVLLSHSLPQNSHKIIPLSVLICSCAGEREAREGVRRSSQGEGQGTQSESRSEGGSPQFRHVSLFYK